MNLNLEQCVCMCAPQALMSFQSRSHWVLNKTAATYMYVTLHIGTCTPHHHPGNSAAVAGMLLKVQQKNTV